MLKATLVSALLTASLVVGQLTKAVGPTTTSSAKRATICNVLSYGGSIGSSDIGMLRGSIHVPPSSHKMYLDF